MCQNQKLNAERTLETLKQNPWGESLKTIADSYSEKIERFLTRRQFLRENTDARGWEIARRATAAIYWHARPGVILSGPTGVGKSYLATAIASGNRISFDMGSNDKKELMQLTSVPFADPDYSPLTIWSLDDVGAEARDMKDFGSEVNAFADFMMRFDRLSVNWKRNNPVLITTNLTKQSMQERYGDRVMSRLSAFPWFEMVGEDRRAR